MTQPAPGALETLFGAGRRLLAAAVLAIGLGCDRPQDDYAPTFDASGAAVTEYSFAVHPLFNPQQMHRGYGPCSTRSKRSLAAQIRAALDA